MKFKLGFLGSVVAGVLLVACSTQKNAFLNRTFHGMTAKYNGYFNANELLALSLTSTQKNRTENYFDLLPIQFVPSKEESKGMLAAIDTAVVKCSKVIRNHSMPSAEGNKEAEFNPWIDENWITIGKAFYWRGDYQKALKNFQFVKRFFQKDPSKYIAELWIARIFMAENQFTESGTMLDALITQAEETNKQKGKGKEGQDEMPPVMDKNTRFEVYKTKAAWCVERNQLSEAILALKEALVWCPTKTEKLRLSFILGQLYQIMGDKTSARQSYKKVINPSASPDMGFNARLNYALLGGNAKDIGLLNKMLKDAKNAPYKDQILYAKALIELELGNLPMAKVYLTSSAFYSVKNPRQKAMAYEKLADLSYSEKAYPSAQKYYDSCAKAMPQDYPNASVITAKAAKLQQLVFAIEVAQVEDSLQRVAKMPEKEQTAFIKEVIKQLKEEAQRKKALEEAKLRALQEQAMTNSGGGEGSKWIFNNQKLKDEGFVEFRKMWGDRKNEDDWRRSSKISEEASSVASENRSENPQQAPSSEGTIDTLTVENLRKKLPLTDSLFKQSVVKEIEARYTAGLLFKELLNEAQLAESEFLKVLDKDTRSLTDLSSAFQLYKLNEGSAEKRDVYKNHIIRHYPKSDAANYFMDPDFFTKVKERKAQKEKEYLALLKEYELQGYKTVYSQTEKILLTDSANALRAEYLLLNVMAYGQITNDKKSLEPKLKNIISEKPGTPQAARAQEWLTILQKGYSTFEPYVAKSNGIYIFNDSVPQLIMVSLDEGEELEDLKYEVSNVAAIAGKNKLKVTAALSLKGRNLVLVSEFKTIGLAADFLQQIKASFNESEIFVDNKILIITQENLKKLIETDTFDSYKDFYDLNY